VPSAPIVQPGPTVPNESTGSTERPADVTPHLGWPDPLTATAPGLGWPDTRTSDAHAAAAAGAAVLGEQERSPRRDHLDPAMSEAPPVTDVSRETAAPAPGPDVPRAADLVGEHPRGDASTPLARAAEHSVAVATGRPLRRQLPRPAKTRVMVVANQKGGVGKTTTAVNVAAALAQHGLKILVIDLDPQGNASTALSVEHGAGTPGSYQVLVDGTPIDEVIIECAEVPGLFAVPASIDLAGAEIELVSLVARETRLRRALDAHLAECADVDDQYDYVFIDCPPSLGLLTVNALSAGEEMLIPIQCEYYALEGLSQLLNTVDQIREHLNPNLSVGAIMLTMYDARTRLAAGVADEVREHFGDLVLKTAIPRSVRISEAPSYGQTVLTYDPGSAGALSYLEAAGELALQTDSVRGSA
jgi:chromosome partitioning protein